MLLPCFVGICADIAQSKHEHWSSLAPLPFEVVISAGQKAKEESWNKSERVGTKKISLYYFALKLTTMTFN